MLDFIYEQYFVNKLYNNNQFLYSGIGIIGLFFVIFFGVINVSTMFMEYMN